MEQETPVKESQETITPEFYFSKRQLEVRLLQIRSEIAMLELEEENIIWQLDSLIQKQESTKETKPKTLKKTNDQSSRNSVEVQE